MPTRPRRSPQPQERKRDPERSRKLIVDAAAAEFGAHGYAGARVSAIAARAGVNQQLISYYFDGKQGLYQALAQRWLERRHELAPPGTALPEQMRRYALEALHDPDGPRLLAWRGLEYAGPSGDTDQADPDRVARTRMLEEGVAEIRALQQDGRLPAELDPACLLVMLMAAAMAPTTLPQVMAGVLGADPRSPDLIEHFADQVALLVTTLGRE